MLTINTKQYLFAALSGVLSYLFLVIIAINIFERLILTPLVTTLILIGTIVAPVTAGVLMYLAIKFEAKASGLIELIKFALVGGLNTLIDLGVLNILLFMVGPVGIALATLFKGISFIVAVINSYVWNKYWTFEGKGIKELQSLKREFLVFLIISIVGLGINITIFALAQIILFLAFNAMPVAAVATLSAIVASLVSLGWNFIGYKNIVFTSQK